MQAQASKLTVKFAKIYLYILIYTIQKDQILKRLTCHNVMCLFMKLDTKCLQSCQQITNKNIDCKENLTTLTIK